MNSRRRSLSESLENEWSLAAAFPRQNGSGGKIATDPETGNWLLASGTWFHADGYSSGEETRLLRRFFEVGAERLAGDLEGFFVLIFGDSHTSEVVVVTDIVGSCHCFQRSFDDAIVLSGSSLLLASLEESQLDLVACQEFLFTGIIYEDRTCYREVRKLKPATIFRFANGTKKTEKQYWRAADVKMESLRGDSAVDALWEKMRRAAGRIHTLYRNPICDLTGGYDSRALVATFLGAGVRCSTAVSGADDSADVRISTDLAKELGLPHLHNEPLRADLIRTVAGLHRAHGWRVRPGQLRADSRDSRAIRRPIRHQHQWIFRRSSARILVGTSAAKNRRAPSASSAESVAASLRSAHVRCFHAAPGKARGLGATFHWSYRTNEFGFKWVPQYISDGPRLPDDANAALARADCKQHESNLAMPIAVHVPFGIGNDA